MERKDLILTQSEDAAVEHWNNVLHKDGGLREIAENEYWNSMAYGYLIGRGIDIERAFYINLYLMEH